ncbi:hypothetical protein M9Y10_019198 [Tritrichomonas musculus]|uniref:Uncharacterized protein n=1 Tax=Tritrichomonas musculus TaxID=1915356 RepID=A0ABR2HIT2_9EUKA
MQQVISYFQTLFQSVKLEFQSVFNNPERRFALLATIGVSLVVVVFLCTDLNRLNRIFYKPELSIFANMLNFCAIMFCCFLFGAFFSRLTLWVRSGSFSAPNEGHEKKKNQKVKAK